MTNTKPPPMTAISSHTKVGDAGCSPKHIAVIMDGNGRWANAKGLHRFAGHKEGVEALRRTVDACKALEIEHLTVFSFSTENWRRPKAEIEALFGLLKLFVRKDLNRLHQEGVRIRIFGSKDGLTSDILYLIDECHEKTKNNSVFNVNIAFNYGGRAEIVEATKLAVEAIAVENLDSSVITEDFLKSYMWTSEIPDVDLLIRTSGEYRISNFLLWGIAYSELMFLDVLWPDFGRVDLESAIEAFKTRNRRFGGLKVEEEISSF